MTPTKAIRHPHRLLLEVEYAKSFKLHRLGMSAMGSLAEGQLCTARNVETEVVRLKRTRDSGHSPDLANAVNWVLGPVRKRQNGS